MRGNNTFDSYNKNNSKNFYKVAGLKKYKKIIMVLLFLILGIGIGIGGAYLFLHQNPDNFSNSYKSSQALSVAKDNKVDNESVEKILESLDKHLLIKSDDFVSTAKIVDVKKLKSGKEREFYKDAKNGDYVIIFKNYVLIYSIERDKIINIAPVLLLKSEDSSTKEK